MNARTSRAFHSAILTLAALCSAYAQPADTLFRRPLDLPVLLSATFAELRDNHFHSGIDYRTQGTAGHNVYACADGYISRIAVSPAGYGNALYITHPDGHTTVYAHLDTFAPHIATWVKQQQYAQKRFAVNLYPHSSLLTVRRGDVIALSGNTGGSSGPHLHFEVRDTRTQQPLNPMQFGLGITDSSAPVIRRLAIYPAAAESTVNGSPEKLILNLEKTGTAYRIPAGTPLHITGTAAFGIDAFDHTTGTPNICGPYSIQLTVDGATVFTQTMNRFSFDETRYVNSLIDYEHYISHRVRFNRLFIEPGNRLSVYGRSTGNGTVSFTDTAMHSASVMVSDFHGNVSRLHFTFAYTPAPAHRTVMLPAAAGPAAFTAAPNDMYRREFRYTPADQGISVFIPAGALYSSIAFTCTVADSPKGLYSKTYRLHDAGTPLHRAMTVGIDAPALPARLRSKALIVRIGKDGKHSSAGGAYADGVVQTSSTVFGSFAIGVDTVPPVITPLNVRSAADMRSTSAVNFRITDNLSGISTYTGTIDGQWALFEYDAKNSLLFYRFDAGRVQKNTTHTLELRVTDGKGNTAVYSTTFTW